MSRLTASDFVAKWRAVELTERSASQQHFLDLCEVVEHPKPAEVDRAGEWFTFERGAVMRGGGRGWADVWKRGFFGWEYKGKGKNLDSAFDQLLRYRESLENPPLLVVCDMDRFRVHTNFTAAVNRAHEIPLEHLPEPENLEVLRSVFHEPDRLKPKATVAGITKEVAERLAGVAQSLRAGKVQEYGKKLVVTRASAGRDAGRLAAAPALRRDHYCFEAPPVRLDVRADAAGSSTHRLRP